MGPAYGQWVQTGDREFQLTFYAAMWNKEGVISGFHRIQATVCCLSQATSATLLTRRRISLMQTGKPCSPIQAK